MDFITSEIVLFKATIPFVFWSAVCFYVFLIAVLLAPPLRKKASDIFSLPPPSEGHIAFLDVIRGLAILWVASFHTWQWLGAFNEGIGTPLIEQGFKGVIVFAVLSGFLVYRSLSKEELSSDKIRAYIVKRFIRVYPLYLVTVLYPVVMGYVDPNTLRFQDVVADIFMLGVFTYPGYINPVGWFIHILVLFYIFLPLWMISTRKYRLHSAIVAFVVLCLVGGDLDVPVGFQIIRYFVLGMITSDIAERIKGSKAGWGALFLASGSLLLFSDLYLAKDIIAVGLNYIFNAAGIGLFLPTDAFMQFPGSPIYTSIAFGIGFALVLIGIIKLPRIFNSLSFYPLRVIGIISYSIYMWHGIIIISDFPILFDGKGSLAALISVPSRDFLISVASQGDFFSLFVLYIPSFLFIAALSYVLIERPFLRLRRKALN